MTTSEPPELTTKGFHDTLVRRVKDAMTVAGPEDRTIEALGAIVAVLEPAIGREPVDSADERRELIEWATTRHGNFSQTPM
jgi:hypothetical protein